MRVCPKTGRVIDEPRDSSRWPLVLIPLVGLISLIWFLIRVVPKPSRATYPCQRVAGSAASGFIFWLIGMIGAALALRKSRIHFAHARVMAGVVLFVVGVGIAWFSLSGSEDFPAYAGTPANQPFGVAKGIFPGRVVWVHDPIATYWPEGYSSPTEHWYDNTHTNQAEVDKMMSQSIQNLSGSTTDAEAWGKLFHYYNQQHNKGDVGYQAGEKIMIKLNLVTCDAHFSGINSTTYEKAPNTVNNTDVAPQMVVALLHQLVDVAGVAQENISVGDPTCLWPNAYYNIIHAKYPNVHYVDNSGGSGRNARHAKQVPAIHRRSLSKSSASPLPGRLAATARSR